MKPALTLATLLASTWTLADYSSSIDAHTCWDGLSATGNPCMVVADTRWSLHTPNKFMVTYRNTCEQRIYARFCNERQSGSHDCGTAGLAADSTVTWSTHQASGEHHHQWIGVTNAANDWVCVDKLDAWQN